MKSANPGMAIQELAPALNVLKPKSRKAIVRMFVVACLIALATLATSGCISTSLEIPKDWPSIDQSSQARIGQCPDISGKYADRSSRSPDSDDYNYPSLSLIRTLYSVINGDDPIASSTAEISQPSEEEIRVKIETEGWEFLLDANKGHFSCSDGVVKISLGLSSFGSSGIPMIGIEGESYAFFRTEDLSLVAKNTVYGGGLFFIIPIGGKFYQWYLWEQME